MSIDKAMTGHCAKCGTGVMLGRDGACIHCHSEICWECWVAEGHECPQCHDFNSTRETKHMSITTEEDNG